MIRAQFMRHGVYAHHIGHDCVDTFGDVDRKGNQLWWSARRDANTRDADKRNGVLAIRRW